MIGGTFYLDDKPYVINKDWPPDSKYPKLVEYYKLLYDKEINEFHNAAYDTALTAKCFSKLSYQGKLQYDNDVNNPYAGRVTIF